MTNVINITHASCLDGLCAAWLVKKVFPDCVTLAIPAGSPLPAIPEGADLILVTDLSFQLEEMNRLKETGAEVVLLDHHATAFERLEGTEWGAYLTKKMSGALITEQWLKDYYDADFSDSVSEIVARVSDNDLWEHKLPENKEFIAYAMHCIPMDSVEKAFMTLDDLADYWKGAPDNLIQDGKTILSVYQKQYAQAMSRAVWSSFAGYRNVPVVNCDWTQSSDVGNALARLAKERNQDDPLAADFAICWCVDIDDGEAYIRVSLRSVTESGQCLDFAQFHGGGGHIKACGCRFKPSVWFEMLHSTTGEEWQ